VDVQVQNPSAASGELISLAVRGATTSTPALTWITGTGALAYALAPPPAVEIDGAFADWSGIAPHGRDGSLPERLDIRGTATNRSPTRFSAFLQVEDGALGGVLLPERVSLEQPGPGGGAPGAAPTGEDLAIAELEFSNGEKFRIVARGRGGAVVETSLEELGPAGWEPAGQAQAGAGASRIEMGAELPAQVAPLTAKVRITVRGWDGAGETVGLALRGEPLAAAAAAPRYLYDPILSDQASDRFSISWVADQPVTGVVEYCASGATCTSSTISPVSAASDASPLLDSGAALVRVTGLAAGVTYFYRVVATNGALESATWPPATPYPSVTTRTNTDIGAFGNPAFSIRPYWDVDGSNSFGDPPDVRLPNFLAYLNHTGAGTLASRGDSNLRNNDAVGAPHVLSGGDLLTFSVAGLFNDGTGNAYWANTTFSATWNGAEDPVVRYVRVEKLAAIPDSVGVVGASLLAVVASVALAPSGAGRRGPR
jgi:hypothetical protein